MHDRICIIPFEKKVHCNVLVVILVSLISYSMVKLKILHTTRIVSSSKKNPLRRPNILRKPVICWGGVWREGPPLCSQVVVRDPGTNLHSRTGTTESGVNSNFKWDKTKGGFWVCFVAGRPRDFCGVHNSHLAALFAFSTRLSLDVHRLAL